MGLVINTNGSMYSDVFLKLGGTEMKVLLEILKHIDDGTNLVQIGGEYLLLIMINSGYSEKAIRNSLSKLNKVGICERTNLRGEYIVNPLFAVAGSEESVWRMYSRIENDLKLWYTSCKLLRRRSHGLYRFRCSYR